MQVLSRSAVATAVMQECMRLTPPVRLIQRQATEDAVVGGVRVPAGTNVALAIGAVRPFFAPPHASPF